MCQAKPGPRCSSHARDELNKAKANMHRAMCAYEGLVRGPKQGNLTGDDWKESDNLMKKITDATNKYASARLNYDSTPDGIKNLTKEYEIGVKMGADDTVLRDMRARLAKAQALRERRLVAQKFVKKLREDATYYAGRNKDASMRIGVMMVSAATSDESYGGDKRLNDNLKDIQKRAKEGYTRAIENIDKSIESGEVSRLEWRAVRRAHEEVLRASYISEGVEAARIEKLREKLTDNGPSVSEGEVR